MHRHARTTSIEVVMPDLACPEGDIARQAIELGDDHLTLLLTGSRECCSQLRPAVERIGSFARLDLGELGCNGDALALGEAADG